MGATHFPVLTITTTPAQTRNIIFVDSCTFQEQLHDRSLVADINKLFLTRLGCFDRRDDGDRHGQASAHCENLKKEIRYR